MGYCKKLDRALINGDWLRFFPHSFAKFEAGGISDNARCIVSLTEQHTTIRKPYKFFNFLIDNADFLPLITRKGDETGPLYHSSSALHKFHQKLKTLKHDLRNLNNALW